MASEIWRTKGVGAAGIAATAAALAMLLPATAAAEERTCRGSLGAITVDNLRVPQNATCNLDRTRVQGTVKVERNAVLNATGIRVIGNVQGENARNVAVRSSRVGGSVQVVQGRAAAVRNTVVNADILYDENTGRAEGDRQHRRRQHPGVQEHRRSADLDELRRWQPAMQGERPRADRRWQCRSGEQGGPVRGALV